MSRPGRGAALRRVGFALGTALLIAGCGLPEASLHLDTVDGAASSPGDAAATAGRCSPGGVGRRCLDRPSGLVATGTHIFVANPAFRARPGGVDFGAGFVAVLARDHLEPIARWAVPLPNPIRVAVVGADLWVLCGGALGEGAEGLFFAERAGGLVVFPGGAAAPDSEPAPVAYPLEPGGAPGSWVYLPDSARWVLGSSIAAELYVFDPISGTWIRDRADPVLRPAPQANETLALALHPAGPVAVFSFGRNRAGLLDPLTLLPLPGAEEDRLSVTDELEGPIDAVFVPGTEPPSARVVLTLSSAVASWTPGAADPVDPRWRTAGLSPNAARLGGGRLWVVNSGSNTLSVFPLPEGEAEEVVLPVGSNPWGVAVAPDGRLAYVTGLLSDALYEVDLEARRLVRSFP